jgi:transketolase
MTDLDRLTVNTVRALTMRAVQEANSCQSGMPVGIADAAYLLWDRFLSTSRPTPAGPNGIAS